EAAEAGRRRAGGDERHDAAGAEKHEQQSADELGRERPQLLGHETILGVGGESGRHGYVRRSTSDALIPPKPNELVSTISGAAARPSRGRQSRSQAGSGRSRLMGGGSQRRSTARAQIAASMAPLAPRACP